MTHSNTNPRSGQYLTHAHSHITRVVAATARVIWLCACVRYWPDLGLMFGCVTNFYCCYINLPAQRSATLLIHLSSACRAVPSHQLPHVLCGAGEECFVFALTINGSIHKAISPNRPFPSCLVPLFQSESKCEIILVKMTLICMKMKLHFHMKGFALRLVLNKRHKRTRKWPIAARPPCHTDEA